MGGRGSCRSGGAGGGRRCRVGWGDGGAFGWSLGEYLWCLVGIVSHGEG